MTQEDVMAMDVDDDRSVKRHKTDSMNDDVIGMARGSENRGMVLVQDSLLEGGASPAHTTTFKHLLPSIATTSAATATNATSVSMSEDVKKNIRFSVDEDKVIEEGVSRFGTDWPQIIHWGHLNRTPRQIKSRYDRILLQSAKHSLTSANTVAGGTNSVSRDGDGFVAPTLEMLDNITPRPKSSNNTPKRPSPPPKAAASAPSTTAPPARRTIEDYFKPLVTPAKLEQELAQLRFKCDQQVKQLDKQTHEIEHLIKENHQITTFYEDKLSDLADKFERKCKASKAIVTDLMRNRAIEDYRREREQLARDSLRLGSIRHESHGRGFREIVTEGWAFDDIRKRQRELAQQKEEWERAKKSMNKRKHGKQVIVNEEVTVDENGFIQPRQPMDMHDEEEALRMRQNTLKKDEAELQLQLDRLTQERDNHFRNLRRAEDEDASRFRGHRVMANRYLLLKMVGKGGFSEVYKSFDLTEFRQVAVKIQSLSPHWSAEKKSNYIRHSVREFRIHRALNHPRVVQFYDIFEIDDDAFGIVLEFCDGSDLDQYLRAQPSKCLPEKEARSIMVQVFSGLKYLNQIQPPIIHYDLKPGNILVTSDGVKITDFGLSKIVERGESGDGAAGGVELTSQGAGTYWYLPPECFISSTSTSEPVKISSKVDVWSAGVVFYQMLYGVKPFGQDQSQQTILVENTIVKAYHVQFPAKPSVSTEAKEFIKRCLEYRKELRPDVLTVCEDGYLKPRGKASSASSMGN